nr:hypothetical protein [Oscillospiraceae bacterium]
MSGPAAPAPDREPVLLVAVDAAAPGFDRLYSYTARAELRGRVRPGMRVAVPFGKGNRRRIGMVLKTEEMPAPAENSTAQTFVLKPAAALLDAEPVLTDELLMLVNWLHEHTFCTWYDAVRAVLPGGLQIRLEE